MVRNFVHILLFLIVALQINAQKNGQNYVGRTLGDSAVQFSDNQWLNQRYIYGRYTASYGAPQKLKLGSMFTITGDSVTVTSSGGTGDVNQNGNSYGATMILGTNDNNQFRIKTNNVERLSITAGTSTGGLFTHSYVTATTNAVVDAYTINATSTGTVASGFGTALKFTAPNASGVIKDLSYIKSSWTTALSGSEYSKIGFHVNAYGTTQEIANFSPGSTGTGTLRISSTYPLDIDGLSFIPASSSPYEFGPTANTWKMSTSLTSNNSAINLNCTGQGSGTTINNATISGANPTSSNILSLDGSVTTTSTGSNSYTGLKISNTLSQGGGHTGTTRGIYISPTLTTPYDYRAIDIANTLGKGIYQSSTGASNTLVGKTVVGSSSSPVVMLQVLNGRFSTAKGADVAAASDLTLGSDGNMFKITGITTINRIINTNWPVGTIIYLIFSPSGNSVTVVHNSGTGSGTPIFLAGSINMNAVPGSTLTLGYDGSVWQEFSRKFP